MDSDKKKDQPGVYDDYPPDQCPYDNCSSSKVKVYRTCTDRKGAALHRVRECLSCGRKFITKESVVELIDL